MSFSPKDYFFKSAKVFGEDIDKVLKVFNKKRINRYQLNHRHGFLEFHVQSVPAIRKLDVEVAISSNIIENRENEKYLRELKLDLTYPQSFHYQEDI